MPIYEVTMDTKGEEVIRVGAPTEAEAKKHAEIVSAPKAIALGEAPPRATRVQKVKD